jgi:hypothetical protein
VPLTDVEPVPGVLVVPLVGVASLPCMIGILGAGLGIPAPEAEAPESVVPAAIPAPAPIAAPAAAPAAIPAAPPIAAPSAAPAAAPAAIPAPVAAMPVSVDPAAITPGSLEPKLPVEGAGVLPTGEFVADCAEPV